MKKLLALLLALVMVLSLVACGGQPAAAQPLCRINKGKKGCTKPQENIFPGLWECFLTGPGRMSTLSVRV